MDSPVVFQLTADEWEALRRSSEGKARTEDETLLISLYGKRLTKGAFNPELTPAGETAAVFVRVLDLARKYDR